MTGRIIRSKKSDMPVETSLTGALPAITSCPGALRAVGHLSVVCLLAFGAPALAAPLPKLPVIQNVGVVPVQWEGSTAGFTDAKAALDETFPKTVRDSRRFRVLSDDLVASLWKDAEGRNELRNDFEMQGLVSLTVTPRGDVAQLTARLMDGWLKTNLLETDTVKTTWLQNANDADLGDRLQRLVFRLFNRLPVDVSITSVQGAYITLSGGAEQGIEAGDKVDLIRAQVSSLHPATGTWHEFKKQPLGNAKVIEVKSFTSVAKLTDQVKDGAVEVGDGARIAAISSRVKFARQIQDSEFKDSGKQDTIIVPPLYQGEAPKAEKSVHANPTQPAPAPKGGMFDPPADNAQPGQAQQPAQEQPPASEDGGESNEQTPPEDQGPTVWDQFRDEATSHRIIEDVTAYAGPFWWTVKGPGNINSSGRFPVWLLNSVGGGITRVMFYKVKADLGGGVMFGNTPAGSYFGYRLYGRGYWQDDLNVGSGFLKHWRIGGAGTFSGMQVPKGGYGGGDWLRIGFMGGLDGSISGPDGARYDWFGDFTILPLNIGRVGYDGSYKSVESSLGSSLSIGAYRFEPPRVIQWGGGLEVFDERQTLKNGRRPHFTEYTLKVLAKYSM